CTSPRSPQPSRPLPTPSSWSIKPAGTCPRASSCRPISPSFCCRRSAQSSTRSRTSGSSCATTGSPTASSNPTTISSTIVVRHGTSSSISLGASCPSDCANGPTGSDQWDLVLRAFEDQRHAPKSILTLRTVSFDHLVGEREQPVRNLETKRLRGLEIDDQLEFGRQHDRQVGGLVALGNATDIDPDLLVKVADAGAVAHQTTRPRIIAELVDCMHRMPRGKCDQSIAPY